MFGPTIEVIDDKHAFLSEDPLITLQKGNFQKIPWITGVNSHEGLFGSAGFEMHTSYTHALPSKILSYL
jgi:hypothetical protein